MAKLIATGMANVMASAMAIAIWQNALLTPLAKWPTPLKNYLQVGAYVQTVSNEVVPSSVVSTVEAPTHARSHR